MTDVQVNELIEYMDKRFDAIEIAIDKMPDGDSFGRLKNSVDRVCRKLDDVERAMKQLLEGELSHRR